MSFWNRIVKSDRHTKDTNNLKNEEVVRSNPAVLPSSKALIYSSELEYIARCIQDFPNISEFFYKKYLKIS